MFKTCQRMRAYRIHVGYARHTPNMLKVRYVYVIRTLSIRYTYVCKRPWSIGGILKFESYKKNHTLQCAAPEGRRIPS